MQLQRKESMELKQLQFLVVCAQTQSFSKAANLLFTTQSNVSKVIKALEEELGIELFERKQYGITLTEHGKRVYGHALSTLESAKKIVDFTSEEITEELRISCNPSSWMAKTFRDYYNEFGRDDINYHIMSASTNEIIRRLANDLDQLGFVYIMEQQLPLLQASFARNHISFRVLKKTDAMIYFGNEMAASYYHKCQDENKQILLVQGYEDEFTLKSFLDVSEAEDHQPGQRVAVTTNSDYVMQELLHHTKLANVGCGSLGDAAQVTDEDHQHKTPLYRGAKLVIFGCLFRNDQNMGRRPKEFLHYVEEQLKEPEGTEQHIGKDDTRGGEHNE